MSRANGNDGSKAGQGIFEAAVRLFAVPIVLALPASGCAHYPANAPLMTGKPAIAGNGAPRP